MRLPRFWPLALVAGGVVLVGSAARTWMHASLEVSDNNDLAHLAIADTALFFTVMAALLVVAFAHVLLDRMHRRTRDELIQAKAALRAQLEQESETRRLKMLAALAAGLAHELGQPLSVARVGIEGLHYLRQLGREPSVEQVERTLGRVGMSLLAMTQTIEHLRGLSADSQRGKLTEIDLVACIRGLLDEREQWLHFSDAHIDWKPPEKSVVALADHAGLRMILTNLTRNALEAVSGLSEERRMVRITVGPGPVIAVHDSGPGIAPEIQANLFDPFISTKAGGAMGIGLSLARASAQRMGAELRVISQPGCGSTFSLHLLDPSAANAVAPDLPP